MAQDHWLHGFNFNVEEWFAGDCYETLAICRTLALARACRTSCSGPLRAACPASRPVPSG
jgi:hypothetical protein